MIQNARYTQHYLNVNIIMLFYHFEFHFIFDRLNFILYNNERFYNQKKCELKV